MNTITCDHLLPPSPRLGSRCFGTPGGSRTAEWQANNTWKRAKRVSLLPVPHVQLAAALRSVCTRLETHTAAISCDHFLPPSPRQQSKWFGRQGKLQTHEMASYRHQGVRGTLLPLPGTSRTTRSSSMKCLRLVTESYGCDQL